MPCDTECAFVEEREPSGRLILAPCAACGTTAMDALLEAKRRAAAPFELRETGEIIDALFTRCDAGIVALYMDRNAKEVGEIIMAHGNYRIGQGLAAAVIAKIEERVIETRTGTAD